MPRRSPTRNLIKFSHYSTCLILPKEMLEELDWHQGDAVTIKLDVDKRRLEVTRDTMPDKARELSVVGPSVTAATAENAAAGYSEEVLPIPELPE